MVNITAERFPEGRERGDGDDRAHPMLHGTLTDHRTGLQVRFLGVVRTNGMVPDTCSVLSSESSSLTVSVPVVISVSMKKDNLKGKETKLIVSAACIEMIPIHTLSSHNRPKIQAKTRNHHGNMNKQPQADQAPSSESNEWHMRTSRQGQEPVELPHHHTNKMVPLKRYILVP